MTAAVTERYLSFDETIANLTVRTLFTGIIWCHFFWHQSDCKRKSEIRLKKSADNIDISNEFYQKWCQTEAFICFRKNSITFQDKLEGLNDNEWRRCRGIQFCYRDLLKLWKQWLSYFFSSCGMSQVMRSQWISLFSNLFSVREQLTLAKI